MKETKEKWQEYLPIKQTKIKTTKGDKKMDNKQIVKEAEVTETTNSNSNTVYTIGGVLVVLMIATNSKFVELACKVLTKASVYNWIIQVVLAVYVLAFAAYKARKNR